MKLSFQQIERAPGIPASIAYLRETSIHVVVDWENDQPSPIKIVVEGSSTNNGTATIIGADELTNSGTIVVRGDGQTEPGHSGQLRLEAEWAGKIVASSNQFSVCAHPCGVRNGPDVKPHIADTPRGQLVGMYIQIGIESDSGDTTHLFEVDDRELVSGPRDHSVSMNGYPTDPPEIADPEKVATFMIDRHRISWQQVMQICHVLSCAEGFWFNDQLDLFQCSRCQMPAFVEIPNSGFRIERRFFTTVHGRICFAVRKSPANVQMTYDGIAYQSAAGLGELHEVVFDVEYMPPQVGYDVTALDAKMDEALARSGAK